MGTLPARFHVPGEHGCGTRGVAHGSVCPSRSSRSHAGLTPDAGPVAQAETVRAGFPLIPPSRLLLQVRRVHRQSAVDDPDRAFILVSSTWGCAIPLSAIGPVAVRRAER